MLTVSLFVSTGLVGLIASVDCVFICVCRTGCSLSASVDCVFICVCRTGWFECEC